MCVVCAYPVVLVGSDGDEPCFREAEGAEVAVGKALTVPAAVHQHHMQPRLVAMHGVQDHLQTQRHCMSLSGHMFHFHSNTNTEVPNTNVPSAIRY